MSLEWGFRPLACERIFRSKEYQLIAGNAMNETDFERLH